MLRSRILGTGKSVPSKRLTNFDLEKMVETSDEWIVGRTGIRERRILEEGRTTSDLAAEAGRIALSAAEISPRQLDAIVVATISPDSPLPACAVAVQRKLGASGCAAFDAAAACAGFIYGLAIGDAFIRGGIWRRVLVVGVEVLSRYVDWTDRNTCVLFGDGAGAVVLGAQQDTDGDKSPRGILSTHLFADGSYEEMLNIPAGGITTPATPATLSAHLHAIKMNGKGVFVHAVRNMSRASIAALEANGKSVADVDLVVAHQANQRILEAVSDKTQIPWSKFFINIQRYGNTSSASIPIALDEAVRDGRVHPGNLLLFSALGAGFSWGSALVRW